jgi:vacuolar protein sorting-associated protein 51
MRTNMDPLAPATSTLSPAISHIAETASSLSSALVERTSRAQTASATPEQTKTGHQKQTVRWALHTPQRMEVLLAQGRRSAAESEFNEIKPLLEQWQGVDGVAALREHCESLLEDSES